MKKIFYLSLAVFMCLLYGCSPEGTDTIILPAPPEHIGSGNSNGGGNSSSSNDRLNQISGCSLILTVICSNCCEDSAGFLPLGLGRAS